MGKIYLVFYLISFSGTLPNVHSHIVGIGIMYNLLAFASMFSLAVDRNISSFIQ